MYTKSLTDITRDRELTGIDCDLITINQYCKQIATENASKSHRAYKQIETARCLLWAAMHEKEHPSFW